VGNSDHRRAVAGTGLRDVGGPLFLMIVPSLAVFVLTYAIIHLDGSFEKLCKMILKVYMPVRGLWASRFARVM